MKRSRLLLALGAALALAAVPASPAAVGAGFTASAPTVAAAGITTATVDPLVGGLAARSGVGLARVSWQAPAAARTYSVVRSVDGLPSGFVPTVSESAGVTSFTDDLTVAVGSGCAAGWLAVGTDRCAPGPSIPVVYGVESDLRGWSSPEALTLTASFAPRPIIATPPATRPVPNEVDATIGVTNISSVPLTVRLSTPTLVDGGALISFSTSPSSASGCDPTQCWQEATIAGGASLTAFLSWRGPAAATVLSVTVSSTQGPATVVDVVAP